MMFGGLQAVSLIAEDAVGETLQMAGATGLEPAISGLTGQRVNQLHHAPAWGLRGGSPMVGRTGFEPVTPCL